MKVIDAMWYNAVGIVLAYDEYEGFQYFIGVGDGFDEKTDAKKIADWGSKFDHQAGDVLFDWVNRSDRYMKAAQ